MRFFENLLSVRERDYIFFVNISKSALIVNDDVRMSYIVYRISLRRSQEPNSYFVSRESYLVCIVTLFSS